MCDLMLICEFWDAESNFCTLHRPSAQPEREKGTWEVCNVLDYAQRPTGRKVGRCSHCGHLTDEFRKIVESSKKLTNFCPDCGADMRKEIEDAEI